MRRAVRRSHLAIAVLIATTIVHVTPAVADPTGGAVPPPITLFVAIAGQAGVPDDAVGVALNVTVTNPAGPGFLTVYPCGDRPLASNLNYVADQTVPNFVVAGLDENGEVCIDTIATTDVIVDVAGYIPAGSPMVPLPAPQRFLDTRAGLGAPLARLAGGGVLHVSLAGAFGVPADATTVVFNATAVQPSVGGFLTVFPCGQSIPETSTLNFAPGGIVPNLVVSAIGDTGTVCFYSNVDTDLIADVAAYVSNDATGVTTLDRPHRIVDTRIGLGGPLAQVEAANRVVAVGGQSAVPTNATAAIVNLTATGAMAAGYAAAFPCGGAVPLVSNLNFTAGANVANLAIVKLATDGTFCLTANRAVDMVVDVLGYTAGDDSFVPLTPSRLYDTREGFGPRCNLAVRIHGSTPELVDLTTGAVRPLQSAPSTSGYSSPRAFIGPDCRVYLMLGYSPSAPPFSPNIFEFEPDGRLIRSYFGESSIWAMATTFGLFEVRQSYNQPPQVIRADNSMVVFDLPNLGQASGNGNPLRLWTPIGASADGSLFAMQVVGPDGFGYMVAYFTITGQQLGIFAMPPNTRPISMSPDGVYLALAAGRGPSDFDIRVTTFDGLQTVSTSPAVGHWSPNHMPEFIGFGTLYGCQSGATRWDLFSGSLMPLIPALPTEPCVLAAG